MNDDVEENFSKLSLQETDKSDVADENDTWENLFDDEDDEYLSQSVGDEVKDQAVTCHAEESDKNKKFDYYSMKSSDLKPKAIKKVSNFEADWVVEIYDFHPSLKTPDIVGRLHDFKSDTYVIKWVDDTHALLIFSNSELAERAIGNNHAIFKVRPLNEASPQSVDVARMYADSLKPVPTDYEKPKTTSSVARRMISNALGVRLNVSSEKLKAEREALRKAREEKKNTSQRKDYWNDSD